MTLYPVHCKLWETWTGTTYQPVASRNHIMFGSNSDWYYKYLAGQ